MRSNVIGETQAADPLRLASPALIRRRVGALGSALRRATREPGALWTAPIVLFATGALLAAILIFGGDARIALAARAEPPGVRAFLEYLTDLGLILWYFYPALFLALFALTTTGGRFGRSHGRRYRLGVHAGYLAASLGIATTITHLLKWLLGRARPPLLEEEGTLGFAWLRVGDAFESFPSGHSTNVGVLAVVLGVWFPALRWPLLVLGFALALTRIPVEAHFASDVVAGFAIGVLSALTLGRFLALRHVAYRAPAGGEGWRGVFPHRPGACRGTA